MPRFTITTLLWLTALFATGMGTFGPGLGVLSAGLVCAAYAMQLRWPTLPEWLVVIGILGFLVALLLPPVKMGATSGRRYESMNRMKQLAIAMHNFQNHTGVFPPGHSTDPDGRPLHSWRTLLLPYLNEQPLYDRIDLDETWDSHENSRQLANKPIEVFRSPMQGTGQGAPGEAHYLAVVDEQAVFRPGQGIRYQEITDPPETTIVLIEASPRGIAWHEPRDLTIEEAVDLLTGEEAQTYEWIEPGFFVSLRRQGDWLLGRNVAFADGHIKSIGYVRNRELARGLLTRAGGEEIPEGIDRWDIDDHGAVVGRIVHWRRVLSTALFVGLAIGPLFRRQAAPNEATSEELNHEDTKTPSET